MCTRKVVQRVYFKAISNRIRSASLSLCMECVDMAADLSACTKKEEKCVNNNTMVLY